MSFYLENGMKTNINPNYLVLSLHDYWLSFIATSDSPLKESSKGENNGWKWEFNRVWQLKDKWFGYVYISVNELL